MRLCVLQPHPRPGTPTYMLSVYEIGDAECIGYELNHHGRTAPISAGLFDKYPDVISWSDEGVCDLFDFICEAEDDWEDAEAVWHESRRHYGSR